MFFFNTYPYLLNYYTSKLCNKCNIKSLEVFSVAMMFPNERTTKYAVCEKVFLLI